MARSSVPVLVAGLVAAVAANPAHAGWSQYDTDAGCNYFQAPLTGVVAPLRVECDWDVDPATVRAFFAAPGSHDRAFSGLAEAEVIAKSGLVKRVYQRYQARGASDREAVIDYGTDTKPGLWTFWWKKADDQSQLRGDAVEIESTEGRWEVHTTDKGAKVVWELRLSPGGYVPAFIVRWFQASAIKDTIRELKTYVGAT